MSDDTRSPEYIRRKIGEQINSVSSAVIANARNAALSLEDRFWPLDDVVCALAPDGEQALYEEWTALFNQLEKTDPTFKGRRDEIRGLSKP